MIKAFRKIKVKNPELVLEKKYVNTCHFNQRRYRGARCFESMT